MCVCVQECLCVCMWVEEVLFSSGSCSFVHAAWGYTHIDGFLFLTFIQMHWNANKWFWNIKIILCAAASQRAPPDNQNFVIAEKETFSKIVRLCKCSCGVEFVVCNTFQPSLSLYLSEYSCACHLLKVGIFVVRKTNAELLMLRLKPSENEQKTFQSILLSFHVSWR